MAAGRKTGGRKKGTPNKATADIKALAQSYTNEAVMALAGIMRSSDSDAARVAAVKELLDRGHGKVPQAHVGGDPDSQPIRVTRIELVDLA
jgi:hypothetical protein